MDVPYKDLCFAIPLDQLRARYLSFRYDSGTPGNLDTARELDAAALPEPLMLAKAAHIASGEHRRQPPPLGHCMYCGAKEYLPGSQRRLGDEHIVAAAIDGTWILPESSCKQCENRTSAVEQVVLGRVFGVYGRQLGLRERRGKRDHVKVPLTIADADVQTDIRVPIGDHPTLLVLPIFLEPGLLSGRPDEIPGFGSFWGEQAVDLTAPMGKHPHIVTPLIDITRFCQLIAKISHGYCVATLGEDLFTALLPSFITREVPDSEVYADGYRLVGGFPSQFAPSASLHQVAIGTYLVNDELYLSCAVRLFGNRGAPIFTAVVGKLHRGVTHRDVRSRADQSPWTSGSNLRIRPPSAS